MDGFYHQDERDEAAEVGGCLLLAVVALLLLGIAGIVCLTVFSFTDSKPMDGSTAGANAVTFEELIVTDTMADNSDMAAVDEAVSSVPVYLQTDERWGGLPYATFDGTVSTHGCGLTCAAMAYSWFEQEDFTPADLLNAVGNTCVDEWAGVNDMTKFCEWMQGQDPTLGFTVIYDDMDRALEDVHWGRLVFASMDGELVPGGKSYGGHIVLLCAETPSQRLIIHDPYDEAVSNGYVSLDDFYNVNWDYFISIGRE